jgi:hypothetical protein
LLCGGAPRLHCGGPAREIRLPLPTYSLVVGGGVEGTTAHAGVSAVVGWLGRKWGWHSVQDSVAGSFLVRTAAGRSGDTKGAVEKCDEGPVMLKSWMK